VSQEIRFIKVFIWRLRGTQIQDCIRKINMHDVVSRFR